MNSIQKEHVALIIKYTGISFITGGLSHGFFSGQRQILTAIVGVIFFILGILLEKKSDEKDYMRTIVIGTILAISIGALTGGLQHFPDSPTRSAWLVPVGFIISVYSFFLLEKKDVLNKSNLIYSIVGLFLFIGISFVFYEVVKHGYIGGSDHHHGDNHNTISQPLDDHHSDDIEIIDNNQNNDDTVIDTTATEGNTEQSEHIDSGDGHDDHSH